MKAFLCILLCVVITNSYPLQKVYAQEELSGYSRVLTTDTAFYSDSGGKNLKFYLPYGYYVKVIAIGSSYTKVSYQTDNSHFPLLTGYVKTLDLIFQEETPITPYPLVSLTVLEDDILFSDYTLTSSKIAVYENSIAVYYGEITFNQEQLVYVYCNGYLGYMRKSCFAPFTIPPHPEPIKNANSSNSQTEKQSTNEKAENLQILIVAGVSVIVVSFVYFIFKPNGKRVKEEYYADE